MADEEKKSFADVVKGEKKEFTAEQQKRIDRVQRNIDLPSVQKNEWQLTVYRQILADVKAHPDEHYVVESNGFTCVLKRSYDMNWLWYIFVPQDHKYADGLPKDFVGHGAVQGHPEIPDDNGCTYGAFTSLAAFLIGRPFFGDWPEVTEGDTEKKHIYGFDASHWRDLHLGSCFYNLSSKRTFKTYDWVMKEIDRTTKALLVAPEGSDLN